MDQDPTQQKLVPAVERAAGMLDIIAAARRFLTVSELARESGLAKSTAHSLLMTMVELGMLIRRPDQTYSLGPHLLRWSNAFDRQTDVATEFAALWDQTPVDAAATVTLSVPEADEMVFIALCQSTNGSRFPVRPGMRLPAAYCAAGHAIFSTMSDFEIRRLLAAGLPAQLTTRSVENLDRLLAAVHETRDRGYALEKEQSFDGVTSLAAPVLNSLNRPMAAVMMSLASETCNDTMQAALAEAIVAIARRLSRRMGAALEETQQARSG